MNWKESSITSNSVRWFLVLALIILVLLLAACAGPDSVSARDISKELTCQCSCGEVLSTCHCPTADEMRALIEKKLTQGQSAEQIVQYFVNQYGEQILAP